VKVVFAALQLGCRRCDCTVRALGTLLLCKAGRVSDLGVTAAGPAHLLLLLAPISLCHLWWVCCCKIASRMHRIWLA